MDIVKLSINRLTAIFTFLVLLSACGGGTSGSTTTPPAATSPGTVTTFTGTAGVIGSTDGIGVAASFKAPSGITSDGISLFVSDEQNHIIRKIVIATGSVSTFAGTAGVVGSTDGVGAAASFNTPTGIATDGTSLFIADFNNHIIRKIDIATKTVTTLAGTAGANGSTDGTGAAARFMNPFGVAISGTTLYVTDRANHTIRKINTTTKVVTTFAGTAGVNGSTDGTGAAASFSNPAGIAISGTSITVTEMGNDIIRHINANTAAVTTIAGTAGVTGSADGVGAAASFTNPTSVTSDGTSLFITDNGKHTVRKINIATSTVTTLTGTAGISGSADGVGLTATFKFPFGITTDGTSLFVTDNGNNTIRKITK